MDFTEWHDLYAAALAELDLTVDQADPTYAVEQFDVGVTPDQAALDLASYLNEEN